MATLRELATIEFTKQVVDQWVEEWRNENIQESHRDVISEASVDDVLDAVGTLEDYGLTSRFWKAHNANSALYHNKNSRFYADDSDKIVRVGKVSDVLRPEVLRHVSKSAHGVPVYVTYRLDSHGCYGRRNGEEAIFVRPGAPARLLWHILHEVKHAIDKSKGKDILTDPETSTPEKYRCYRSSPSEKRAEAFAKRVIMRAASELDSG